MNIRDLQKRLDYMREQQESIVPVWRLISDYICPNRGSFDFREPNRGERRDRHLADSTPARALGILQAGMQGGLTSPSRAWFRLQVADPALADIPAVMKWTDDVQLRIGSKLSQSNIYNCLHSIYGEIGAFGIGALFIEDDYDNVIQGKVMTAGEYFVSFGMREKPDAFGRVLWMTASQMAAEFGEERVSEKARAALGNNNPAKWFKVNHLIFEDTSRADNLTRFPVAGVYWEDGATDEPLMAGGYEEFPVLVPRWEIVASDFYGYGPGWFALGESKTLQALRKDYLTAQKKVIDPPVWGSLEADRAKLDLLPGGLNFGAGELGLKAVYQINPDIPGQLQAIRDSQEIINSRFFSDLFLMIAAADNRNMTATEVQVRQEEKMQMLGPVVERLEHELLDPLIGRVFGIMNRRGMFPPPPVELEGQEVKIEYVSMLALAQRASGIGDLNSLMGVIAQIAQMAPDIVDKLNGDQVVDTYVRMTNVPAALIRSDEEVAMIREARAQQQQAEQMAAMAPVAAQTLKTGAEAVETLGARGKHEQG